MRTFDNTGKEFLSNYIGRDYAVILPTIYERHGVIFGKASDCNDPVLIRLNDQEEFRKIFRKEYSPPDLSIIYKTDVEEIIPPPNEIYKDYKDDEDDVPF